MAAQSWTLIDVDNGVYLVSEPAVLRADGVSGMVVRKTTRRGGLSDGVDVLEVTNGDFRFRVLPTRGMGIWDAELAGERIGWKSPVRGPVHPQFVDLGEPSGLGWLDGFDELLVRCGLESNGAVEFDPQGRVVYPLHGRIANRPAHRLQVSIDDQQVSLVGEVEETRFHFFKVRMTSTITSRRGERGLRVRDEILNLSQSPAQIQMLYHVNFGIPLLDAGARVVVPLKTLVPRNARAVEGLGGWDSFAAEEPGFVEQVYFVELLADADGLTRTLLKNAHGTRGASLVFSTEQLPCFTLWKNTTAVADGYVTGLEPGTNYPNPRSYEGRQGRVVSLEPGGRCVLELALEVHGSAESVDQAERAVSELQGDVQPTIFPEPQANFVMMNE